MPKMTFACNEREAALISAELCLAFCDGELTHEEFQELVGGLRDAWQLHRKALRMRGIEPRDDARALLDEALAGELSGPVLFDELMTIAASEPTATRQMAMIG